VEPAPDLEQELHEILRAQEVFSAPLFEALGGETLSLLDLKNEVLRCGTLCGVAIAAPSAAELRLRQDFAALLRPDELPDALWQHAAAQEPALKTRPRFVVWFDGPIEWLRQAFSEVLSGA